MDTFHEAYHLAYVHPTTIAMQNIVNCAHFQEYGRDAGRMTTVQFTCKIMADGEVEESRWGEPAVLRHVAQFYQLVPNYHVITAAQNQIVTGLVMCAGAFMSPGQSAR